MTVRNSMRLLVLLALAIVTALALFPPWRFEFRQVVHSCGHSFIFAQSNKLCFVDVAELITEWVGIVGTTLICLVALFAWEQTKAPPLNHERSTSSGPTLKPPDTGRGVGPDSSPMAWKPDPDRANSLISLAINRANNQSGLATAQQANLRRLAKNLGAAMAQFRPVAQGLEGPQQANSNSPRSLSDARRQAVDRSQIEALERHLATAILDPGARDRLITDAMRVTDGDRAEAIRKVLRDLEEEDKRWS